jgi:DNA-binding protein HU-beta
LVLPCAGETWCRANLVGWIERDHSGLERGSRGKKVSGVNKQELIEHVSSEAKITKKQAGAAIDSMLGGVSKALKKGERVILVGFGTFLVMHRRARKGRNPQTGEPLTIKAAKVVKFRPGADLAKKTK